MSKTTQTKPMTSAEFDAHCELVHSIRAAHQAEWVRKVLEAGKPAPVSHYTALPADDPRRFSFDIPREDNPTPFGPPASNDRIRTRRGPR